LRWFLTRGCASFESIPQQKNSSPFCGRDSHSLYLVEKLVLGCGLSLVFLVVLFLCFCFQRIFISLQKRKVLEFVLEPSFFASFENILPVRFVREEEKRDGK
jgi:hypothetical protein